MSQHDLNIANQGFPAFRADLNDALVALGSTNSGATAPATTYANQLWYDTANNILKIRNEDNDAWISLLTLNQTADTVSEIATAIATLGAGSASNPALTTAGDANTGIFFPAADTIAFAEGGVEVMRITSAGDIGIGTATPYNNASFTALSIGGSKVGFIGLNNASGTMQATIDTFDNKFRIGTNGTTNPIVFNTGGSVAEAMRILSDGKVAINNTTALDAALLTVNCTAGTGGTTPLSLRVGVDSDGYGALTFRNQTGTQGSIFCNASSISMNGVSGITFKATQQASADVNTLDDYEEGTWTPSIGGTATYSPASGTYTKIGKLVTFQMTLYVSSVGTGNQNTISGLPFANTGSSGNMMGATINYFGDLNVSVNYLAGYIPPNSSSILMIGTTSTTASVSTLNVIKNASYLEMSGYYYTS